MASEPLKEFLYVDVDRTRSLLAQLQGGVVESLTSESASTVEGSANASLFGLGGGGAYSRGSVYQESRSFQDMVFVAFETLADQHGLVTNLGGDFSQADKWESGAVHSNLREGQLVRATCDVQILDGALFRGRLERLDRMMDGLLELVPQLSAKNSTPQQRRSSGTAAKTAMLGGFSPEQLSALSSFVDAFVGNDIAFRALMCGQAHLTLGFGGTLLGRREYIQEERDSLFSRYGTVASSWTCVMQVAAIPRQPDPGSDESVDLEAVMARTADATENLFDRAKFERMAVSLLESPRV